MSRHQKRRAAVEDLPGSLPRAMGPGSLRGIPIRVAAWYRSKRTVLCFVGLLVVVLGVFHLLLMTPLSRDRILPGYLRVWANASAAVMRAFGEPATVVGSTVSSPRFSVNILQGCDAVDPTTLFIAAVLVSPVSWRRKAIGLLVGVPFILAMNLVRVVSLFYTGIYFPAMFELMHFEVWQVAFIFLSILCWGLWAVWAVKERPSRSDAVSQD